MIRKVFAFIVIVIFLFLVTPLLFILSVMRGFFNENVIRSRLVPASYPVVTELVAEGLAKERTEEIGLFRSRMQNIISPEEYTRIIGSVVTPLFEGFRTSTGKSIVLDLEPLRKELKTSMPDLIKRFPACRPGESAGREFRLCLPQNVSLPSQFESTVVRDIERQIPKTTAINVNWKKDVSVEDAREIFEFLGLLPWFVAVVALILVGILSLIIFSPAAAILKWNGYAFAALAVLMALFIAAAGKLTGKLTNDLILPAGFTAGQKSLIFLLVSHALSLFTVLAYVAGGLGAGLFGWWWFFSKKSKHP